MLFCCMGGKLSGLNILRRKSPLTDYTLFAHGDSICFILGAHVNQIKMLLVTDNLCREAVYLVGRTLNTLHPPAENTHIRYGGN